MTTQAAPTPAAPARPESRSLAPQGLRPSGCVHWNLVAPELIQQAVRRDEGLLADMGPFVAVTSPHTGRSPNDKFVVEDPEVAQDVWWGKVNRPLSPEHFDVLLADVRTYLDACGDLFVQDLWAGADPAHRLSVRFVSPNAWHMQFVRNMFLRPTVGDLASFASNFTVLHAPEMQADPARHGTRTGTFVVLDPASRMILIGGTRYAGELKKAMFTVMNYYMPKQGVLSMHCSANIGPGGDTALFFGLSGTGKTTLSADPSRALIGDDEHGWSPDGVFNFEGGCYAKAINLSAESEPDIYSTTQRFGTILENCVLDPATRTICFADASITENTRVS
jgi:phosphoenolpyruvate carboxykinase (ATP)